MPDSALFERFDQAIEVVLAGGTVADPELAALARIAGALQHMPSEHLKHELKKELERRATMPATSAPAPAVLGLGKGFKTMTPFLIHEKAPELVDFIKTAFLAEELKRNEGGDP